MKVPKRILPAKGQPDLGLKAAAGKPFQSFQPFMAAKKPLPRMLAAGMGGIAFSDHSGLKSPKRRLPCKGPAGTRGGSLFGVFSPYSGE